MISVVSSMKNESGSVDELYKRIISSINSIGLLYEIVFVDDGSEDNTYELLTEIAKKDKNVIVIKLSRDFGHHAGISAGLDYTSGDYVVMMDADLQDKPEEIPNLYEKLKEGNDVVYGERVGKKFSIIRRFFSFVFLKLIQFFINEPIVINTTIFRIMNKKVVEAIRKLREGQRYLVGVIGWVGFKHAVVYVKHGKRKRGKSKYNFIQQMKLAFNAIFSFSDYPVKLISRIGFLLTCLSFCMGCWVVIRRIFFHVSVVGWASVIVSIFFFGGLNILFLGVLGEYVGRTYIESKRRPLYIVEEIINYKNVKTSQNN